MAELQQIRPAQPAADLAMLKKQIQASRTGRLDNAVYEAVKASADIQDSRVKFF